MPIVMIAVFNVGDLIGKVLPFLPVEAFQARNWTEDNLVKFVLVRIPLVLFIVLCATPNPTPALQGEGWGLLFELILAVTGGYTATLAMFAFLCFFGPSEFALEMVIVKHGHVCCPP